MNGWTVIFDEAGGDDCMTGGWEVIGPGGNVRFVIDQADFGQPTCDYDYRSAEAERLARFLADALNAAEYEVKEAS